MRMCPPPLRVVQSPPCTQEMAVGCRLVSFSRNRRRAPCPFREVDEAQASLLGNGDERPSHDSLPRLPPARVILGCPVQRDRVVPEFRSRRVRHTALLLPDPVPPDFPARPLADGEELQVRAIADLPGPLIRIVRLLGVPPGARADLPAPVVADAERARGAPRPGPPAIQLSTTAAKRLGPNAPRSSEALDAPHFTSRLGPR
jgi:hypothetical protein